MSTATIQPHSTSVTLGARSPPTYEFSKRKRWGDLLLTELVDDVAFILSPKYKILYCGPAITELLGWRDIDLSDLEFTDLMDSTDQARFRIAFEESLRTNVEFDLAVRLRGNKPAIQYASKPSPLEVLFDVKFYPHAITTANELDESVDSQCIFAMASPYPSRNAAMLATSLELRAQNERLQQKVMEHRNRCPAETSLSKNSPTSLAGPMYAVSSLQRRPSSAFVSGTILHKSSDPSGAFSTSTMMSEPFDSATSNTTDAADFGKPLYTTSNGEDGGDEGTKKKKQKRAQNAEQHVCKICGRTDSPEWRKGPDGPKTLCNACGLRWAKQARKVELDVSGGINSATATTTES